jgi:putative tryptophan/tyrosine transport system substrate-binding protein
LSPVTQSGHRGGSNLRCYRAERIANVAMQSRLPTLFFSNDGLKAGGLASYAPNLVAIYRRLAYYVDRILKGAKPGDLPIEPPTNMHQA